MGGFIPNSRNTVGGGRHEVGGGHHIKTLALGENIRWRNWINTFVLKIYEKGATPLVGLATATVWHFLRIPGGSGPQVYWAHMGGFIPNSRNRVGGGRHEVGGGRHIKTLALGKIFVGENG